jgi:hypothetical protein
MFNWLRRVINRSEEIYCIGCRRKTRVSRSRKVDIETKKGVSTRLIGTCLRCNRETSTFVSRAKKAA